ncbi:MAG: flagellin [Micavibrio sp.]
MANISTLGQYLDQIARLKGQQQTMGDLTLQISSGRKTQKLSGLGSDIMKTQRARVGVNSLDTYITNIKNAERRIKLMQTGVGELKAQAETISNALTISLEQGDYPDFDAMKELAGNVYGFILNIMNQVDGDRYLYGGGDVSQQPITDTGLFQSALGQFLPDESDLTNPPIIASGLIGDWGDGTITTDEFIAAYRGISDTVLGYSDAITSGTAGKTHVRVNDQVEFDYTTLANNSAMKDIVIALGVLQQLPPVEYAPGALNDPAATALPEDVAPFPPKEKQENFFKVIGDLSVMLNNAIDDLDKIGFKLSQTHGQLSIVKEAHTAQINAYKDVIGDTETIDITEASVKITQLQTQIQASFQVTAMLSQLTLANYLR